ncbi:MAG: helix-turn-helix domain-containing protein [Planctomycetota bacterium]
MSKLTNAMVAEMIDSYHGGMSRKVIARKYGISRSQVNKIVRGQSWRRVSAAIGVTL